MMKLLIIFNLFVVTVASANTTSTTTKVSCPCPLGINDECTEREICVYGINDNGEIFHNGKKDVLNLTNIALKRKAEIENFDDVVVNLFNTYTKTMSIFYYGCQRCEDLMQIGNITEPKLSVFLLSLYNQRMKYNIKYSQSDFVYYNSTKNEQQPMPEITVRPFWKYRLEYNRTCAHKQQGFTQKHYIPAFLSLDICILDYKYIVYLNRSEIFHTDMGEITYSLTLSNNDLYQFDIIANSTFDLQPEFRGNLEMCKASFNFDANKRSMRFFCLCDNYLCTLKVAQKNPEHFCPYTLGVSFNTTKVYSSLRYTTNYMNIDKFFLDNVNNETYCFFVWWTNGTFYNSYIKSSNDSSHLPDGYTFESTSKQKWFCPFMNYKKEQIVPIQAKLFQNETENLGKAFFKAMLDHSVLLNTVRPVGANCTTEGPLADSFFSSGSRSNPSMFPCYKYFELNSMQQIFPIMGVNMIPITIAKGKECYYYTVKIKLNHFKACSMFKLLTATPILSIVSCQTNISYDLTEIQRFKNVSTACPLMAPNETQWMYAPTNGGMCGQFLRGLKIHNGMYVPEEIEFREVTTDDFKMTTMGSKVLHGCGFNSSQMLTLCTCYAALGGCDVLDTAGRLHLLRYLPMNKPSEI